MLGFQTHKEYWIDYKPKKYELEGNVDNAVKRKEKTRWYFKWLHIDWNFRQVSCSDHCNFTELSIKAITEFGCIMAVWLQFTLRYQILNYMPVHFVSSWKYNFIGYKVTAWLLDLSNIRKQDETYDGQANLNTAQVRSMCWICKAFPPLIPEW